MLFGRSDATRPAVLPSVAGQARFERGSAAGFGTPDRAALLVHWAPTPWLSRSFVELANQFARHGYRPVVVSACEAEGDLQWGGRRPADVTVIRKPNIGYDFGSWAVGLEMVPALRSAGRVVLANDSLAGPFADIGPLLARFEACGSDVFGLTDTRQYFLHLQSYFLGFTGGILDDPPLRRFFAAVRDERDKWDIINRYELGLNRLFRREGYGMSAAFRADDFVSPGENATIRAWWKLLDRGFPFVKREILRTPEIAPRGEWVAREVLAIFGERIEEWV